MTQTNQDEWQKEQLIAFQQCKDMSEVLILIDKIYCDCFNDGEDFGRTSKRIKDKINRLEAKEHPVTGKLAPADIKDQTFKAMKGC